MATKAAASTRKRTPFYFKVSDNNYAELKLRATSFDESIRTVVGALPDLPANGITIAKNKADALARGIFFLTVEYQVAPGETQTAKIPVAPDKADTAFEGLKGKTYNGKNIVEVRVPRRRVFVV